MADISSFEAGYSALRQQIAAQTSRSYDSLLVAVKHRDDFKLTRDLSADFLKKTQARFEGGHGRRGSTSSAPASRSPRRRTI